MVATLIYVLDSNILHIHIQRYCGNLLVTSEAAGRAMSSCMGLCLPPFVLWRQHTALQRSDFNHFSLHRHCYSSFSGYLVKCLLWRCNLYVFLLIKCASFRSEFTFFFRKGTDLLKFLRRFLNLIFFFKEREYLCIVSAICHSFNTLTSCNFLFNCRCTLASSSYLRCMVSIISAPQLRAVVHMGYISANK